MNEDKLDESQTVLDQIYIDVCMFYIDNKKIHLVQRKEAYRAQLIEVMKSFTTIKAMWIINKIKPSLVGRIEEMA